MSTLNDANFILEAFSTREQCLQYLCELKWGAGFKCRKCAHTVDIKGKAWYYRKCQSCKYEESCTSQTLFHKLKFPITTAFALVYQLSSARKGMSSCRISKEYRITVVTAWFFRVKVQLLVSGTASVGFEEYMRRSLKKRGINPENTDVQGIRKSTNTRSGKSLSVQVNCTSEGECKSAIANITGDAPYIPRRKWGKERWSAMRGKNYKPRKSKKCLEIAIHFLNTDGDAMTQLFILNMKNWMAGVHHFLSMAYLEGYMREFEFRYYWREKSEEESMMELMKRTVYGGKNQ